MGSVLKRLVYVVSLAAAAVVLWPDRSDPPARRLDVTDCQRYPLNGIRKALENFYWAMGRYPTGDEGLAILYKKKGEVADERYAGPYLDGNYEDLGRWRIHYQFPGRAVSGAYDLWCDGPNEPNGNQE